MSPQKTSKPEAAIDVAVKVADPAEPTAYAGKHMRKVVVQGFQPSLDLIQCLALPRGRPVCLTTHAADHMYAHTHTHTGQRANCCCCYFVLANVRETSDGVSDIFTSV